jgi:hypothetical protein
MDRQVRVTLMVEITRPDTKAEKKHRQIMMALRYK